MIYSGTLNIENRIPRKHIYEGWTEYDIEKDIKGADKLYIVSAVGSLNPHLKVGDIVMVKDLITLFYQSWRIGAEFTDMSKPFNEEMQNSILKRYPSMKQVTHVFMRGPRYETYADNKALMALGGDVVGMSMLPEVIVANKLKIPCVGLCVVTDDPFAYHSHEEVKRISESREKEILEILNER